LHMYIALREGKSLGWRSTSAGIEPGLRRQRALQRLTGRILSPPRVHEIRESSSMLKTVLCVCVLVAAGVRAEGEHVEDLLRRGASQRAVALMQKELETNPQNTSARVYLARALAQHGSLEDAQLLVEEGAHTRHTRARTR
jgi:hypothetical protein